MFALYYAAAGLTAFWVYRHQLTHSMSGALLGGLAPIAGSALLIWVAVKAIQAFTVTERWVLAGIVVAGVVMLLVARFVYKAPSLTGAKDADLAPSAERT